MKSKYKRIRVSKTETRDEHRLVMEQHLGRRLESTEIIHHRDGCPRNNDIENLEITNRSKHAHDHQIGRKLSEETKNKISKTARDKPHYASRKLTTKQVQFIRLSNLSERKLAKQYSVSKTTIHDILAGKIYRDCLQVKT